MTDSENYSAFGEVYNVREHQLEFMDGDTATNDESWYEYRVFLQNENTEIVDEWDSLSETYNGIKGQRLTEEKAQSALDEIIQDVEEGKVSFWFDLDLD